MNRRLRNQRRTLLINSRSERQAGTNSPWFRKALRDCLPPTHAQIPLPLIVEVFVLVSHFNPFSIGWRSSMWSFARHNVPRAIACHSYSESRKRKESSYV